MGTEMSTRREDPRSVVSINRAAIPQLEAHGYPYIPDKAALLRLPARLTAGHEFGFSLLFDPALIDKVFRSVQSLNNVHPCELA